MSNGASAGGKGRKKREKQDTRQAGEPIRSSSQAQPDAQGLHPLENEWTLWYDRRPGNGKRMRGEKNHYESNLTQLGKFAHVEHFWQYFNHVCPPSRMEMNSNYHLFKEGIKPMWEDENNMNGGKWVVTIKKGQDMLWQNAVLAVIGEVLDDGDEICGVVFSRRRKGDRIAVWNRNKTNEIAIMSIGHKFRQALQLDSNLELGYQCHDDSLRTGASYTNPDRYKA